MPTDQTNNIALLKKRGITTLNGYQQNNNKIRDQIKARLFYTDPENPSIDTLEEIWIYVGQVAVAKIYYYKNNRPTETEYFTSNGIQFYKVLRLTFYKNLKREMDYVQATPDID